MWFLFTKSYFWKALFVLLLVNGFICCMGYSFLNGIKVRVFFEKSIEKKHFFSITRIIITFVNQIFQKLIWLEVLKILSNFQKVWFCKKIDKRSESFLPNTGNFLALFIAFEWARLLEKPLDKCEVKCNVKLRPN